VNKKCSKCQNNLDIKFFPKNGKYYGSWCYKCKNNLEQKRRINLGIKPKIKPSICNFKEKECLKCLKVLSLELFPKNKRGRFERASYCKECCKIYQITKKNENIQKSRRKSRKAVQKYRDKHREYWRSLHRIHQFNRRSLIKCQSDGTVNENFMINLYNTKNCYWCGKYTKRKKRTAEHIIRLIDGGIHGI
jgi:hypothetical protein